MIYIFEALFILALDEDEGDIVESVVNVLESALAGAILGELVLLNRIGLTDHRVIVTDQTSTECSVLDKALFDIVDATKPRKLKYWVNTLTYKGSLGEIGHLLVEKGLLTRKKKRLHLVIPHDDAPGGNASAKYNLKNRLREIVLTGRQPDPSEEILLAFLYYGELLKLVFTLGERKTAYKRVKKLVANDEDPNHLGETINEIIDEVFIL